VLASTVKDLLRSSAFVESDVAARQ
jgi:hypothetical protein